MAFDRKAWQRDYNKTDKARERKRRWKQSEAGRTSLRETQRKARAKRPGGRLKLYGLTLEAWETMFAQQGRACGACGTTDPGHKKGHWATDHDHITGQVRKILCTGCNLALGHVNDSIPRLRALISYLEAHGRR
jgi:hypothetical protein